ncbi:MAG: hypothetical protein L0287_20725 [Anaerolineae bacterium]|nr:hypothetical protein [Anaerolineae bacterium]
MFKTKLLASILLAVAVLFAQIGMAAAAPAAQDTTLITGTIQSITTETDANGVTTVLVTLVDAQGATQTVRLSEETAAGFMVGQTVNIDPTTVIPDTTEEQEPVHPISAILAAFFFPDDESMASVIDSYHNGDNEEGVFGFGVIAQALWMSMSLTEDGSADADLAGEILIAKQNHDFSAFFPEGTENIPTNWGQFKKAVSEKKNNLGVIVSGQADPDDTMNTSAEKDHGNGKNKDEGNGKGKDKNKNKP